MQNVIILIPVYDDYVSLNQLLKHLEKVTIQQEKYSFSILIVDDGTPQKGSITHTTAFPVSILYLHRNLGHQKAIATGLAYINDNLNTDKVVIMDGDGEDRPDDVLLLLEKAAAFENSIVFAKRKSQRESRDFRLFYWLYKLIFRILTGKKIAFGNFMAMPMTLLKKIVYYSEIWNHIAGGILKSGIQYTTIPTHRGERYAGKSKLNFHALLLHGLGSISVFIDKIASRLLIFSSILFIFSVIVIGIILGIRLFTDRAIPGWTSTLMATMLIVLLQSILLSLFTIFLYFISQSQRKIIPAVHYKDYTDTIEKF
ncbi:MAG: glycosyltransferase family 2 protein [Chitinophagaceae bacterium]